MGDSFFESRDACFFQRIHFSHCSSHLGCDPHYRQFQLGEMPDKFERSAERFDGTVISKVRAQRTEVGLVVFEFRFHHGQRHSNDSPLAELDMCCNVNRVADVCYAQLPHVQNRFLQRLERRREALLNLILDVDGLLNESQEFDDEDVALLAEQIKTQPGEIQFLSKPQQVRLRWSILQHRFSACQCE